MWMKLRDVSSRARAIEASLVLAGLIASLLWAPNQARATHAGLADRLKVWNVNIRQLQDDWETVFDAIQANKPDIVLVQELSVGDGADPGTGVDVVQFDSEMESRLGEDYGYRHAAAEGGNGANVVFFRRPRLDITNVNTSTNTNDNELRWQRWEGDGCAVEGAWQMAVRLWDTVQGRPVVAASLHTSNDCVGFNTRRFDNAIEAKWPVRQMTVIAGDLNSHPQTMDERPGYTPSEEGHQVNPNCWYRLFSFLDQNGTCDSFFNADTYFDSVYLYMDPSITTDNDPSERNICNQWTRKKTDESTENACIDGADEDTERDGSRIDYIWTRWEFAGGGVKEYSETQARNMIYRATAESTVCGSGCIRPSYSDHRAVYAEIRWCDPGQPCTGS